MIDTIKFKGTKGAEAYMEVVEWVYPEVYCSITGRAPRDPPEGETDPVLENILESLNMYLMHHQSFIYLFQFYYRVT